jgi:hypothetical protein
MPATFAGSIVPEEKMHGLSRRLTVRATAQPHLLEARARRGCQAPAFMRVDWNIRLN